MEKLKNIEKEFADNCYRSDNGQVLFIKWCAVGRNFYDYGEACPSKMDIEKKYKDLLNDPRIRFVKCEDCGECAGW